MLRKFLFLLFTFGQYWGVNAQSENATKLEAQLSTSSNPVDSLLLLEKLTNIYLYSDLNQAENYTSQALKLAGHSKSELVNATAYLIAGKTFVQMTKLDSADMFLDKALTGFESLNEKNRIAEVLYWKGYIAASNREFSVASRYYFRAIENWKLTGEQKEIAKTYCSISDMFSMQDKYDKAIQYAMEAIKIFENLGETSLLASALDDLSYSYVLSEQYEKALEYADKALEIYKKSGGDEINIARTLNSRGNALKFLERYEESIAEYERSIDIVDRLGVIRGVVAGTANIGHIYLMQNKYEEALPYILKAIEMSTQAGDIRNLAENYMHASNIYAGLGDFQKANHYTWLYAKDKERQHMEKENQLQEGLADKYEAGQRAATIVLQNQRIQQQALVQWLMIGLAALLALTLIIGWRNYIIKQKANKRLAESNQLLDAKNRENELLLKEIHHRVKNNLQTISSLLSLQSESIQDQSAWDAVQESRNRVNSMALLHQKLYQGENLAAIEMRDYFKTIGKTIIESFGEKAEKVSLNVEMSELELDIDTAVPIGLITNELMTNSLKYAFTNQSKGEISIRLHTDADGMIQLEISDNGEFLLKEELKENEGGFGTLLVQLLTKQLGGHLEKSNDEGTYIVIRFPRQEKSAA